MINESVRLLLAQIDWQEYEGEVVTLVQKAKKKYNTTFSSSTDAVSQISIWTDPASQCTVVNFETKQNSEEYITKWSQKFRQRGWIEDADQLERNGYTPNPANFKYPEFISLYHWCLAQLNQIDYAAESDARTVKGYIEASLQTAVNRVVSEHILENLLAEEEVWIGINSPDGWYDHIQRVNL